MFRTQLFFLHALLFWRVLLEESERLLELRLIELSAERRAVAGSPEDLVKLNKAELARWAKAVEQAGAKLSN